MRQEKIIVLLHREDISFFKTNYLTALLIEEWKGLGFAVEISQDPKHITPADVIVPHIDLTVMPQEYRDFLSHYPVVVNRDVVDISKSKISVHILKKGDTDYHGPVIVKTDRNYGGLPEKRYLQEPPPIGSTLGRRFSSCFKALRLQLSDRSKWRDVENLDPGTYPVFPCLNDVPNEVFRNKHLVVEKFLPEVEEGQYCTRYYYFLGDREVNFLLRSKDPVLKGANSTIEEVPTPPELYALRKQLRFDYGKFDYVLRDGNVILFDANWTPGYTRHAVARKMAHHLAGGIMSIIESQKPGHISDSLPHHKGRQAALPDSAHNELI